MDSESAEKRKKKYCKRIISGSKVKLREQSERELCTVDDIEKEHSRQKEQQVQILSGRNILDMLEECQGIQGNWTIENEGKRGKRGARIARAKVCRTM